MKPAMRTGHQRAWQRNPKTIAATSRDRKTPSGQPTTRPSRFRPPRSAATSPCFSSPAPQPPLSGRRLVIRSRGRNPAASPMTSRCVRGRRRGQSAPSRRHGGIPRHYFTPVSTTKVPMRCQGSRIPENLLTKDSLLHPCSEQVLLGTRKPPLGSVVQIHRSNPLFTEVRTLIGSKNSVVSTITALQNVPLFTQSWTMCCSLTEKKKGKLSKTPDGVFQG